KKTAPDAAMFMRTRTRVSPSWPGLGPRPDTLKQTDHGALEETTCNGAGHTFFECDVAAIEEPPEHARHETLAVRFEKMVGDLGQRHVRCSLDQGEYLCSMPLDPS